MADTPRPQWNPQADPEHTYSYYFGQSRVRPPPDKTKSRNITKHSGTRIEGDTTTTIRRFEPAELSAVFGTPEIKLDREFVRNILDTYGPICRPEDFGDWSFATAPSWKPRFVDAESGFYPWHRWLVAAPTAHASNAVCAALNLRGANITTHGFMTADIVQNTAGGGAADILQQWVDMVEDVPTTRVCVPHEFKRDDVLRVEDKSTLASLADRTNTADGYQFRTSASYSSHEGKIFHLICQASALF
ncbi:hypothetical protein K438DRAFT_486132 [Mycena galopus ATCC 62051]|nr:hypothetical protein K438DRAFT_486132 [Mycena galopus ATCC 62051]